ncbi:MAG TPA: M67 family metallopeptidase [Candidatus Limnocylindria bacterium]|nr:M67 family metallopeptidase [Candidatus Limnocylindria bacterium]
MPDVRGGLTGPLRLPAALAEELLAHAQACLPNEACGLLSAARGSGVATRFHATRNVDASPLRFTVHPEDLVRIVFEIEREGRQLLAIFHSHVRSAAVPSAADRRAAAAYPDACHVLASMTDASAGPHAALRAWRIHDGEATPVALEIMSGTLAP